MGRIRKIMVAQPYTRPKKTTRTPAITDMTSNIGITEGRQGEIPKWDESPRTVTRITHKTLKSRTTEPRLKASAMPTDSGTAFSLRLMSTMESRGTLDKLKVETARRPSDTCPRTTTDTTTDRATTPAVATTDRPPTTLGMNNSSKTASACGLRSKIESPGMVDKFDVKYDNNPNAIRRPTPTITPHIGRTGARHATCEMPDCNPVSSVGLISTADSGDTLKTFDTKTTNSPYGSSVPKSHCPGENRSLHHREKNTIHYKDNKLKIPSENGLTKTKKSPRHSVDATSSASDELIVSSHARPSDGASDCSWHSGTSRIIEVVNPSRESIGVIRRTKSLRTIPDDKPAASKSTDVRAKTVTRSSSLRDKTPESATIKRGLGAPVMPTSSGIASSTILTSKAENRENWDKFGIKSVSSPFDLYSCTSNFYGKEGVVNDHDKKTISHIENKVKSTRKSGLSKTVKSPKHTAAAPSPDGEELIVLSGARPNEGDIHGGSYSGPRAIKEDATARRENIGAIRTRSLKAVPGGKSIGMDATDKTLERTTTGSLLGASVMLSGSRIASSVHLMSTEDSGERLGSVGVKSVSNPFDEPLKTAKPTPSIREKTSERVTRATRKAYSTLPKTSNPVFSFGSMSTVESGEKLHMFDDTYRSSPIETHRPTPNIRDWTSIGASEAACSTSETPKDTCRKPTKSTSTVRVMTPSPAVAPKDRLPMPSVSNPAPSVGLISTAELREKVSDVRYASKPHGRMDWITSFVMVCTGAIFFVLIVNFFKTSTDEGTKTLETNEGTKILEPSQEGVGMLSVLNTIFLCTGTALLGWMVYLFNIAPAENRTGLGSRQTCLPNHEVLKAELHRNNQCEYWKLGARFMDSLHIPAPYFYPEVDFCYCNACVTSRGDQPYYQRGVPPKTYGLPIGWCRYGLSTGPQAQALNVFSIWHVGFHGTTPGRLESILHSRDLLMPGDIAFTGEHLEPPKGHYTEASKPADFDIKQIFVTPTIRYAALPVYAKGQRWTDPTTNKTYNVQVVLQLRIRPESYTVGRDTVGLGQERIDPEFDNGKLEWSTKLRGSTIPTGILVRLERC